MIKPILVVLKDSCDCNCCDECAKVIFLTYIIFNKDKATTCCITPNHFVATFNNSLYFAKVSTDKLGSLKVNKSMEDLKRIGSLFDRIIELDSNINYIRLVSANSLYMFSKITYSNEFIQFETGKKVNEPDRVFIWDLNLNEAVATLDQPN
jgi:hypothetical protein